MIAQTGSVIRGSVYVLGDNIDTDQIIPAQYLNLVPTIPEEYEKLGSYAMAGLPSTMQPFIQPGKTKTAHTIVIGGRNFGCGSSREHAPVALGAAGIQAVVAESYARIFFRNAIATGELFPCETSVRICERFKTGDEAEINLATGTITRPASGETFPILGLGAAEPVIRAGGLFAFARQSGMIPAAAQ